MTNNLLNPNNQPNSLNGKIKTLQHPNSHHISMRFGFATPPMWLGTPRLFKNLKIPSGTLKPVPIMGIEIPYPVWEFKTRTQYGTLILVYNTRNKVPYHSSSLILSLY